MKQKYQVCKRCVMDTSDSKIVFNENGVCNHCLQFDQVTSKMWFPNDEGEKRFANIVTKIKSAGAKNEYDCILGLSGGIDSSYLALKLKDYGLRPLVVHVDAGWNSELAVANIEKIVKYCGFELHTCVMDWLEVRDIQLAYLKSGIANQDVVQDHAFFASLYHFAVKNNISYVISGGNIATESVFPKSWHHSAMDSINLKAIYKKFGRHKLRKYKVISFFQYYIYYPFIRKMKTVRPLNYMPYNKKEALQFLQKEIDYKDYGRKHGESRFTKFFQNHYLPEKFGYDKRRPHLSSMILSNQITRDDALKALTEPLYEPLELREDKRYIAKKLGITVDELEHYIHEQGKSYNEYKNWDFRYKLLKKCQNFAQRLLGKDIKNYS